MCAALSINSALHHETLLRVRREIYWVEHSRRFDFTLPPVTCFLVQVQDVKGKQAEADVLLYVLELEILSLMVGLTHCQSTYRRSFALMKLFERRT